MGPKNLTLSNSQCFLQLIQELPRITLQVPQHPEDVKKSLHRNDGLESPHTPIDVPEPSVPPFNTVVAQRMNCAVKVYLLLLKNAFTCLILPLPNTFLITLG